MSDDQQEIIDLNGDGKVNNIEMEIAKDKFQDKRFMSWVALSSMIVLILILLTDIIDIKRIEALETVFSSFFFGMTAIVGAFMGFTTWASRK